MVSTTLSAVNQLVASPVAPSSLIPIPVVSPALPSSVFPVRPVVPAPSPEKAACADSPTGKHHWKIASPDGATISTGKCRYCHGTREFKNWQRVDVNKYDWAIPKHLSRGMQIIRI